MKKFFFCFSLLFSSICSSAEQSEKSLAYNPNGKVSTYKAPHAGEISYSYDPINRLTGIQHPSGETVRYAYDCNSNLTEVTNDHGVTSYSYDVLNRLVKAQFPENISVSYAGLCPFAAQTEKGNRFIAPLLNDLRSQPSAHFE
jgi:YD repeat-containing protein